MPKIVADETIYNAAIQTVLERGYAGATTKQIAKAAYISEVTLFRKFGSKAELITQAIADMAKQIDFESAARYTGDISADLLRFVQTYQNSAEQKGQFIYTILLEIPRYSELSGAIGTPVAMVSNIGQLLERYQTEGVLKQENPLDAVAGLLGPLIATNLIRNAKIDMPFPPPDLAKHVACFLNGRIHPQ